MFICRVLLAGPGPKKWQDPFHAPYSPVIFRIRWRRVSCCSDSSSGDLACGAGMQVLHLSPEFRTGSETGVCPNAQQGAGDQNHQTVRKQDRSELNNTYMICKQRNQTGVSIYLQKLQLRVSLFQAAIISAAFAGFEIRNYCSFCKWFCSKAAIIIAALAGITI